MDIQSNPIPSVRFTHVGFWVEDLDKMADFYQRVFRMHRSDHGKIDAHGLKAELAFLTRDPEEHHQLVFLAGKPKDMPFNVINQISFRVDSLGDLRAYWHLLHDEPEASEIYVFSHGNAWSIYFHDPEGNRCEVYLDTPWYVEQPFRAELDLTMSDEEILEQTKEEVAKYPTARPIEEWQQEVAKSLGLKDWAPSNRSSIDGLG